MNVENTCTWTFIPMFAPIQGAMRLTSSSRAAVNGSNTNEKCTDATGFVNHAVLEGSRIGMISENTS